MLNTFNKQKAQNFQKQIELFVTYFKHLEKAKYTPHTGQEPIIKRAFDFNRPWRKIFAQCSRNFGKSTTASIVAVGMAGFFPRSKIYIFAPFLNLAKEIYYESNMIADMIPPGWLRPGDEGFNKTELRWRFANGSYIKIDGADNEARVRGIKPTMFFADEFQDWRKAVWEAMVPNFLAHDCPVYISGTPPNIENQYTEEADDVKYRMEQGDDEYLWIHRNIYDNPRLSVKEIEKIKEKHIRQGDELIWIREYLAIFKRGGGNAIFAVFDRKDNTLSEDEIKRRIAVHRNRCVPYIIFDPSGSRFAVSGVVWNTALNEHYLCYSYAETDPKLLTTNLIDAKVQEEHEYWFYNLCEPFFVYDEAAKLWAIDMEDLGYPMIPTQKGLNEKNNNIMLVKDSFLSKKFFLNEESIEAIEEVESYRRDLKGRIIKVKDDIVDTILYYFAHIGPQIKDVVDSSKMPERERYTPLQDYYDMTKDDVIDITPISVYDMLEETEYVWD